MFSNIKTASKKELVPAGTYVARCYSLVDHGTHDGEWQGKPKRDRELQFTFEIPSLLKEYDGVKKPMVVGMKTNVSFAPKANLTKLLTAWIGSGAHPEPMQEWLDKYIVGHPALITINHTLGKDKITTYASIVSVIAPPAGMDCPPQMNKSVKFDLEQFDEDLFKSLPSWQQDKIRTSYEYKAMMDAPKEDDGFEEFNQSLQQ